MKIIPESLERPQMCFAITENEFMMSAVPHPRLIIHNKRPMGHNAHLS